MMNSSIRELALGTGLSLNTNFRSIFHAASALLLWCVHDGIKPDVHALGGIRPAAEGIDTNTAAIIDGDAHGDKILRIVYYNNVEKRNVSTYLAMGCIYDEFSDPW